ncbi:TM2 domain-containing protein almondex [Procambarus clarkii]|uniref:TM2 domain-containing protein almondex n=1 Tax=Procambarus clarkii TaxID=6728 RepID=UPI001E672723|nr:TM2 domain-containing protein almondex-like [Procambarus clarkii]
MSEGSALIQWCCLLFCVILSGCVSDSPLREPKPQVTESNKNMSSPGNNLTGPAPATSRPPTMPENCSDRSSWRGQRDCPSTSPCHMLGRECLDCNFNCTCIYGQEVNVTCQPKKEYICEGKKEFRLAMVCRYCYQTASWEHSCLGTDQCLAVTSPRETFTSNCTVKSDVLCLGNRVFPKKLPCNWTSGYKWSTALLLSITLGGFGADRFYLGHWQEGIGKLFSFGGLGVWTIIDVILIAIRYLGPADGSLYI